MIVTGALCWWNELPEDLDRCVRGLGDVCDRVIALDGAYSRYPTGTARSSEDQLDAIRKAAKDVGLDCMIVQPDRLWRGQVEKRNALIGMASVGSNWFATVDADHIIKADRETIREALKRESADVVEVPYLTPLEVEATVRLVAARSAPGSRLVVNYQTA